MTLRVAITGASAGIGSATAKLLSKKSYELLLIARRAERLESLAKELETEACIRVVDVSNQADITRMLSQEKVDVLINNAGVALGMESFEEYELKDCDQMVQTNIQGLIYCTHAVLPGMIERNQGHIINVGSMAGIISYKGANVYGATKAFVKQFSQNLRTDLLGKKIRVTHIAPGAVQTELAQVRFKGDLDRARQLYASTRALDAEDVAAAILYSLEAPWHVNIDTIEIMPTYQAYNGFKSHLI